MNQPHTAGSPQGEPTASGRAGPLAHLIVNGALAALFTVLFFRAQALPASMWEPLGSGSFPRLVLAVLVVLNLAIMVKECRAFIAQPAGERGQVSAWVWRHRLAFGVLALFAAYILLLPWLGFTLASLGFLLAGQWLLGARSFKGLAIALVVALVFSLGVDTLFRDVFIISLPRGLFG
ncbi:tripartite tricarboxylate transporter TctB family protein [Halomonas sp. B23F22_10]|uniref:tripartite tricarboxylate transporter TctB family protein n=1 Tax=Halomonas sp. B23F22_10 TaxID=3459515 RepID=UPI00373F030A